MSLFKAPPLADLLDAAGLDWTSATVAAVAIVLTSLLIGFLRSLRSPVALVYGAETVQIAVVDEDQVRRVPFAQFLKTTCPALFGPAASYYPTVWLASGHAQTIFASVRNYLVKNGPVFGNGLSYEREIVTLPDGGSISLDWCPGNKGLPFDDTPIVVLMHGISGGSHESYVKDTIAEIAAGPHRYRTVVVNFRGCANTKITTSQLYSAGYTDDYKLALEHIQRCCPGAPMIGVGFSLGANIMLKALGEMGTACPLVSAVSVSNPYDMLVSSRAVHRQWFGSNVYSKVMAMKLKSVFKEHITHFENHDEIDADHVLQSRNTTEFDDRMTRRSFRYRSVDEYYRLSSSVLQLPNVRIPMLCLHSLDDPISDREAIPFGEVRCNPYVVLATTPRGGHLGWWAGQLKPKRWFPVPVSQYITAMFENYTRLPKDLQESFHEPVGLTKPLIPSRIILPFSTPLDDHVVRSESRLGFGFGGSPEPSDESLTDETSVTS
ncbi:Alpha/Beta hydrolase protein [Polychytrium aggregatum]|uniref:Alpha/Beta hydrolase protein n=1 Tax=Polychytrium aggregatum TaxID=110093 RepID=UPI0022FF3E10|nr:Alpha/Beta hydrolase protein [Polychytrium aggregatum]KAI9205562.1 Alpha/Beta hydrolase protein [Polychytrium aggregatum]